MTIYEQNFKRLLKLQPELAQLRCSLVALDETLVDMMLEVVEQHKFTTVVRLSQALPIPIDVVSLPSMTVRVYHDARVAEVLAYQNHRRFQPKYDYPNSKMLQVREKRRVNEFLGEWLDNCLANTRRSALLYSGMQ